MSTGYTWPSRSNSRQTAFCPVYIKSSASRAKNNCTDITENISVTWKGDVDTQHADYRLENWEVFTEFFGNRLQHCHDALVRTIIHRLDAFVFQLLQQIYTSDRNKLLATIVCFLYGNPFRNTSFFGSLFSDFCRIFCNFVALQSFYWSCRLCRMY